MKAITKNLVFFSIGLIILTLLFRFFLSRFLQNQLFTEVWILAALYGILIFIIGWTFGKKDKQTLPLYDIGLRFHVATYLICNLIAEIWFFLGLQSDCEKIKSVHFTVVFWGVGLLIHYILYLITRKNAINGIKKTEIFE
ncbi:MAG: hypothetical protein GXX85_17175 [Ignavibacteria bacterium]|nr:hypothetical protein [Ignavibacteria bacterium]